MASDAATPPPLVRRMLQSDFYPHPTIAPIKLLQTHISYVLLTGPYAYKVKNAVNLGFVDFSALERRRHFCMEELRLNRRAAPQIYLEVLPITEDSQGFHLAAEGTIVEYALKMRQFPQDTLFDRLLEARRIDDGLVEQLARAVADFHKDARADERIREFGRPERIRRVIEDNYSQSERFITGPQTREQFDQTRRFTDDFFARHAALLNARASGGFVRECHGDLHLGNICLWEDKPVLFDCIEFNEAFRFIDVMQDAAFAVMDFEGLGRGDLAVHFLNSYLERTGDWEGAAVVPLYLCRHAYVRGKVNAILASEPDVPRETGQSALATAADYFTLAWRYAQPRRGRLILISGLSGSGKSTIARSLARHVRAIHIRSDAVRKHLFGVPLDERRGDELYTPAMTEQTYRRLMDLGLLLAAEGFPVILDAKYDRRIAREALISAAKAAGLNVNTIFCDAPDSVLQERLRARHGDVSDASADLLERQRAEFEPFSPAEREILTILDTTKALDLSALSGTTTRV